MDLSEKIRMISGWKSGDLFWNEIGFPGYRQDQMFEGYLETQGHGLKLRFNSVVLNQK